MVQMIVAHGAAHGIMSLAPLVAPLLFGGMLYYFVKKNPAQKET